MTTKADHKNINGNRSKWCDKHFKLVDKKFVQVQQKKKAIQLNGTAAFSTTEVSGGYQGEYKDQIVYNDDGSVDAYIRRPSMQRNRSTFYIVVKMERPLSSSVLGQDRSFANASRPWVSTENVDQMNLFRVHIPRAEVRDRVCNKKKKNYT